MSMPLLLIESQVKPFKFYQQGAIHQAIIFQNRVLKLLNRFDVQQRENAYQVALELSQSGVYTVITTGDDNYRVWIDVRDSRVGQLLIQLPGLHGGNTRFMSAMA